MTCGRGVPFATFAVLAVVLVACGVSRPSRLTVENRTRADVVVVTGYDWATRLFVPACGQLVLELGEGA